MTQKSKFRYKYSIVTHTLFEENKNAKDNYMIFIHLSLQIHKNSAWKHERKHGNSPSEEQKKHQNKTIMFRLSDENS